MSVMADPNDVTRITLAAMMKVLVFCKKASFYSIAVSDSFYRQPRNTQNPPCGVSGCNRVILSIVRRHLAAQHMGISRTVLFSSEQGVLPRVDHAVQIARAYNRSVEELWPCPASACPSKSADTNRED